MYLACGTRLNITFVTGELSHRNSNSWAGHLCITKQVLRYLKSTINLGILWENIFAGHEQGKYEQIRVVDYTNSSYARDFEDEKPITGYCFFLKDTITT